MLDRTVAPNASMMEHLALIEPVQTTLNNSTTVYTLKDDAQPVLKLDLVFPFGKRADLKSGQALITAKMLLEGTDNYEGGAFQEYLDQHGASMHVEVDFDSTTLTLLCLKQHAEKLIALFNEVLLNATFDERNFKQVKSQVVQKLKVDAEKSAIVASQTFRGLLFKGSAYADSLLADDVDLLELKDIKSFYSTYYKERPFLLACGDVDGGILSLIERSIGSIPFSEVSQEKKYPLNPEIKRENIVRADAVQASIRLGSLSISKNHADYLPLRIANQILGGYFGSRLMKNIREDKGYTYGIYSSLINYRQADYWIIGADVQKANLEHALEEVYKEINLLKQELVPYDELTTVKNYMIGKLASSLDSVFNQGDALKDKLICDVPYQSFYQSLLDEIKEIDAEKILDIANRYFDTEKMTVVTVS